MKMHRKAKKLLLTLASLSLMTLVPQSVSADTFDFRTPNSPIGTWSSTFVPTDDNTGSGTFVDDGGDVQGTFGSITYTLNPDGTVSPSLPTGVRMNRDGTFSCGSNSPRVYGEGCNYIDEEITPGGVAFTAPQEENPATIRFAGNVHNRQPDGSYNPPLPPGVRRNSDGTFTCGANAPQVYAESSCTYTTEVINPQEGACVGDNVPAYCQRCTGDNPPAGCDVVTRNCSRTEEKQVDGQTQTVNRAVPEDCGDWAAEHNRAVADANAGPTADPGYTGGGGALPEDSAALQIQKPDLITAGAGFGQGDSLTSEGIMSGTRNFKSCQKMTPSEIKWSSVVKSSHHEAKTSAFTLAWEKMFDEHKALIEAEAKQRRESLNSLRTGATGDQGSQFMQKIGPMVTAALSDGADLFKNLVKCVGIASVTTDQDNYSDEDLKRAGAEFLTQKSMDGKITCKAAGPETQDWNECKTLVTTYNAAAVGQVVAQEAQKLDYMDKELDTQTELMADGGKDPTKALKSQETMVRKQAQIANQRAAFHGAKLTALMAAHSAMPTKAEFEEQCLNDNKVGNGVALLKMQYHAYTAAFIKFAYGTVANKLVLSEAGSGVTLPAGQMSVSVPSNLKEALPQGATVDAASLASAQFTSTDATDASANNYQPEKGDNNAPSAKNNVCANAVYDGTNIVMNSEAREQAKQAMVQAGVDMGANLLKGKILDDQADYIASAADGIKNFDPGELPMFQEEDAQVTACQADPTSAECLELENTRGVGYAGTSFNFGGANRATTGGDIGDDSDSGSGSSATGDSTNRSDAKSKMGRSIASINKGGGLDGIAPKAGVKAGGNPAAGGGGGGGAGGAAPPSGGGVRGAGGPGGARSAYKAKKVRYRGGAGGLSFSGGSKGRRAQKKSANPFASLLGKKKGAKGGTLNFRNPASIGAKGGSLFQMISKRYSVVSKKKQLLEYENKE